MINCLCKSLSMRTTQDMIWDLNDLLAAAGGTVLCLVSGPPRIRKRGFVITYVNKSRSFLPNVGGKRVVPVNEWFRPPHISITLYIAPLITPPISIQMTQNEG